MTASQMRIAETIDAFYGDAGTNDGVSRSYKQAVEDLDAETIKALDGPFRLGPPFLLSIDFSSHLVLDPPHSLTPTTPIQTDRPRTNKPLLRILPRHQ